MLQQAAEKLEMSGSEDSAVEVLERAVEKAENANKPHEVYEIEMFLVEMLIYKVEKSQLLTILYQHIYFLPTVVSHLSNFCISVPSKNDLNGSIQNLC